MVTFSYTLTPEEELGMTAWVNRISLKAAGGKKVTIESEILKVLKRFLVSQLQHYDKTEIDKLVTAFNSKSKIEQEVIKADWKIK